MNDTPARLLAWSIRCLPRQQREWGTAMLAELTAIERPSERWHFALGCTAVALFPPQRTAAFTGLLCLLPFAALNAIVATRFEPFFSLIRPGAHTSNTEWFLLAASLLVMPVGAYVALRKRTFYLANIAAALFLLAVFTTLSLVLGEEIYRCEVLQIPNCD
jgi:hypothetical protein